MAIAPSSTHPPLSAGHVGKGRMAMSHRTGAPAPLSPFQGAYIKSWRNLAITVVHEGIYTIFIKTMVRPTRPGDLNLNGTPQDG